MSDAEDKTSEQLAAELTSPQTEQVVATDDATESPAPAPATSDELILGKFKTQKELEDSYVELERNFTASRQAPRNPVPQPVVPPQQDAVFDNETVQGINSIVDMKLEIARANKFASDHKEELADPILRGAVLLEISEANARGETIDQEVALANAKAALDARLAPKVEQASKESLEEGKSISRRKEQASAVGGTNAHSPEISDDELNAEEYAAKYGLQQA